MPKVAAHSGAASPVAVTGMGCICAAGNSPERVWRAMRAGERPLLPHSALGDGALPFPFCGIGEACFPGKRRHSAADTLALAEYAARAALARAQLPIGTMEAAGVVLGTTAGSALHFIESYAAFKAGLSSGCSDRDDYFAANLALALPIPAKGPRLTVTDACTSGADALGLGMDLIRHGECPCVICGGADALSLVPHTGFARLMIYDDRPCRPFDLRRKGLNLGEGGAVFVLESMEHAGQRGADIIGYLLGYGAGADAYHLTAPHPQGRGLASALREALAEAALDARDMAFVNAHGTGTPDNDKVEGRTLASMLPGVPVWAGKGCTGHTLGAAGALEALLSLVALTQGIVPCSPGFEQPDPETMIRPTTEEAPTRTPFALSTSLGFGGGNAALLLGAVPGREGA